MDSLILAQAIVAGTVAPRAVDIRVPERSGDRVTPPQRVVAPEGALGASLDTYL